ncbi:MAG: B12-binding domain-containing radical SAM protein, partial [Candidatus Binatia bacterium]
MKVLLLAPYAGGERLDREGKIFKERVFPAPALGVHHIASHLRRHGHLCDVLDPNIQRPVLEPHLKSGGYDIVGISTNHQTLEHDLGLAHLVKRMSPDSLLLAGGIEATFNPRQVLDYSPIDAIVLGEGEKPMLELCQGLAAEQVPGLYLRRKEDLFFTGHRPALNREEFAQTVMELDVKAIPYPLYWSSLEARYDGQISPSQLQEIRTLRLYTTNYCPYDCAFCSATRFRSFVEGKKSQVVSLNPEEVLEVLVQALAYYPQTETVFFADDDFILNAQRCQEISQGIIATKRAGKLPASLSFIANTRLNNLTPELLFAMEEAGWRIVLCGVESFSPRLLVEYEKKYSIDAV